jgi:hypothetical protein
MDKVCFIIGEGGSERYFIASLLQDQLVFYEPEDLKGGFIYKKQNIYWVLNSPPEICAKSGKSRVVSANTYTALKGQEYSHRHCFSDVYEPHYVVIRDGDSANDEARTRMVREISAIAQPVLKQLPVIHTPKHTIENWFLAGLTEEFEHFVKSEAVRIGRTLRGDVENLFNAKDLLDEFLSDRLSRQRIIIGAEVGAVFNINQAIERSPTFRNFWTDLGDLGLL